MDDISHFDFRCEELGLHRKYLHFLPPSRIRMFKINLKKTLAMR